METVSMRRPWELSTGARVALSALQESTDEESQLLRTRAAMVNILVDFVDEREFREDVHAAVFNILDDMADKTQQLKELHRALYNLIEDGIDAADMLDRSNVEMQDLAQLKDGFIAMASHELRTPLTSIAGFSSTMLAHWKLISEENKLKYVTIIDQESQRLSRLVEDLLTLSQIESGGLKPARSRIAVGPAIRKALVSLDAESVEVSCNEATSLLADPDHFQQIIVNYVTNARKYGAPPVRVEVIPERGSACIRVCDEGPGVPQEFVASLFEPFTRAHHADGEVKGTGLGLSIVAALAAAQGGEAWYEPNVPVGSCFNLRLPTGTAASE